MEILLELIFKKALCLLALLTTSIFASAGNPNLSENVLCRKQESSVHSEVEQLLLTASLEFKSAVKEFSNSFDVTLGDVGFDSCSILPFLEMKILYQQMRSKANRLQASLQKIEEQELDVQNSEIFVMTQKEYRNIIYDLCDQVRCQGLEGIDSLSRIILGKSNITSGSIKEGSVADQLEIQIWNNRLNLISTLINNFIDDLNLLM